jgi:hypothetical protein
MSEKLYYESLEEQATHMGAEARMLLPGVQTILGFQLIAVFNQRFEHFTLGEQLMHYGAFLLMASTMALMMAPAAYHRQVECDRVTARFIVLSTRLLTIAMLPFIAAVCLDTYLIGRLITQGSTLGLIAAAGMFCVLSGLWFVLPAVAGRHR